MCGSTYQLRLLFNLYPTTTQQRVLQPPLRDNCVFAVYPRNSQCHTYHGFGSLQMVLMLDTIVAFCHNGLTIGKLPFKTGTAS